MISELGLSKNIILNSFTNDIDGIFSSTKALIVPSISMESFGLVATEAFLRNVPVIAYKTGGLVEVVSEDVGIKVDTDFRGVTSGT